MKAIVAVIALLIARPVVAETLKKVPAELNPRKAYVLVEYELQENPYADLAGSRTRLPLIAGLSFARYDPALSDIRGFGRAASNPVPKGQQPTEPFASRVLAKSEVGRMLLIEMEPDQWVVQAYGTTSFSLGSYSFRLEPGTITDLGVVSATSDWAEGQRPGDGGDLMKRALLGPFAKRPEMAPMRAAFRARADKDLPVPAGLPVEKVQPIRFTPDAKFGNYLGGLVNRIEGVNYRLRAPQNAPKTEPRVVVDDAAR